MYQLWVYIIAVCAISRVNGACILKCVWFWIQDVARLTCALQCEVPLWFWIQYERLGCAAVRSASVVLSIRGG